jgi:hypothetical protein
MATVAEDNLRIVESTGIVHLTIRRSAVLVLAMWLGMVAVDLLLNAGLFSPLFLRPSSFLLSPDKLFRRIPFGYLDFLLLAVLLLWLMGRLGVRGARAGLRAGVVAGALSGCAFLLGLYSVSTADAVLLVAWFVAGTAQLGMAGCIGGAGLAGTRPARLLGLTFALLVAAVSLTAIMQTYGVAVALRKY